MALDNYFPQAHSRGSSGGSGASDCPAANSPTFSLPDQTRMAGSTSSAASTPPMIDRPESPTLPSKAVLHDLVEEPSEREGGLDQTDDRAHAFPRDEPEWCSAWPSYTTSCDYDLSDGFRSEGDHQTDLNQSRDLSDAPPVSSLKARISQRMPSLSRKIREKRSISNLSFTGVRSAPASRAPSIRSPSTTKSVVSSTEERDFAFEPPALPTVPALLSHSIHTASSELSLSAVVEDPRDCKNRAPTPLLPPCMTGKDRSETSSIQSPLQSPTIADQPVFSLPSAASTTPLASTAQSPTLSTRPSTASFAYSHNRNSTEITRLGQAADDVWADALGHANFNIQPAPYAPIICDLDTCRALTADWEKARKNYLAHAARITDDYGPTSNTFKLTEQKWSAIDAQWKQQYEFTIARAETSGVDVSSVPCLSDHVPLVKMPSISKPVILADDGQIVGPMVTYVSRIKPMPKRNAFLRFFSDLRLSTS